MIMMYFITLMIMIIVFLYRFLEIHFLQDLFTGFKGQPVRLTFSSMSSQLYTDVISKCQSLHGRYLSTPWLCSPHLQTIFLTYFGNAPSVEYTRQIFPASDGGTVALDWVIDPSVQQTHTNPIVMIIPGLTSHSGSSYVKHLAFKMAQSGRNAVVINHRGLGGVALTSDWFFYGGWTGDIRAVAKYLNYEYPDAPLFLVGTSIGANMLVFYLNEEGISTPILGAASICCPWDPLLCDRFLSRHFIQRVYSKAIAKGLKAYAKLHESTMSRIAKWEGIQKARYIRDFDETATCSITNYETVDTYYRRGCSIDVLRNVMVPLLCIGSLDDPICTSEAIPWDECRLNHNVVLATTEHGGHLPHFEGLGGTSLWWVRVVDEFFSVLQSSPLGNHVKNEIQISSAKSLESCVDIEEAMIREETIEEDAMIREEASGKEKQNVKIDSKVDHVDVVEADIKRINKLRFWNHKSLWQIAFRIMCKSWPLVGLVFALFCRNKCKNISTSASRKR